MAGVLGGLSIVFAVAAILLQVLAQTRFEQTFRLLTLDARLLESQNLHRQMRWEMGEFQRDSSLESLTVEMEPKDCELGRWLDGEGRTAAEHELPHLAPQFLELEAAHTAMHDAARRVDGRLRAKDRSGALADLSRYGDSATAQLTRRLGSIQTAIGAERVGRTETLRRRERVNLWMIGGISLLAVLGSLGAGVTLRAHQRSTAALGRAVAALEKLIATVPFGVVVVDEENVIRRANDAAGEILKSPARGLNGLKWSAFVTPEEAIQSSASHEANVIDTTGTTVPVLLATLPTELGGEAGRVHAFVDLSERRQLETQLRHSQKLEAVGQLAAGIAHEINTPAQFVGDSISFLADSYHDVLVLIATYRTLIARGSDGDREEARLAEGDADLTYLVDSMPAALERARDGMSRITTIVRAMKDFAHPGAQSKRPGDLNKAIEMTLIIARNEYKYVADVDTSLGELPAVMCLVGDMNQVFLNLLVNAAHAIADRAGPDGPKGKISVRTSCEGNTARIEIEDTGCGIPEGIRERIFEPFFTTKAVGRGTGQGLAIARSIVVDKHGGTLTFESDLGKGTTFIIRLPVDGTQVNDSLAERLLARHARNRAA